MGGIIPDSGPDCFYRVLYRRGAQFPSEGGAHREDNLEYWGSRDLIWHIVLLPIDDVYNCSHVEVPHSLRICGLGGALRGHFLHYHCVPYYWTEDYGTVTGSAAADYVAASHCGDAGVLAIVYPIFGAIFYRLSGAELTAFIMVMPVIKFITKQIIAAAAKHLKEYVGPIVVFSVDVFNVFYVAICMQASTSLVTTILMVASDSFHVVLAIRDTFRPTKGNDRVSSGNLQRSRNYLEILPELVREAFYEAAASMSLVKYIRVWAPFPLKMSDESKKLLSDLKIIGRGARASGTRKCATNLPSTRESTGGFRPEWT